MTNLPVLRCALFTTALALLSACTGQVFTPTSAPVSAPAPNALFPKASGYQKAVMKTKPIAYFALNSATAGSVGGQYSLTLVGGAKIAKPGAIVADGKKNKYLKLAGQAYASTGLAGGIAGTGSMVAWVNLSELPSTAGQYFYISGESEFGNDFDLQFQNDNNLYFYTGSGENTEYITNPSQLIGNWHMVAVTYMGGSSGFRNIYWDGVLVAPFAGPVSGSSKSAQFSIGESLLFTGRYFQGGIDAVAIWDRALKGSEVTAMYAAAQ